ncbi:MAG TPA: shikimate dehydrogenase [Spirochaetota bacterium]|nr:shikimate dehydrogenase [Spirochaetota bacterium]
MNNINAQTKAAFIIGDPVEHSKSPVFQNAAFQYLNINAVYLALNIEKKYFNDVVAGLKKMDLLGMNVTVPYKFDIMEHIDEFSDEVEAIRSANTIEVKNNRWIGHNTDWYGVFKTLENNKIDKNAKVLIIGAGGATPGAIYGLKRYGVSDISITNRTMSKADDICKIFDFARPVDFNNINSVIDDYSLVINSTTQEFKNLIQNYNGETTYFDLKYWHTPSDIKNFIDGKDMLVYQGAKSFEIWTGKEAPIEVMKKALTSR